MSINLKWNVTFSLSSFDNNHEVWKYLLVTNYLQTFITKWVKYSSLYRQYLTDRSMVSDLFTIK